MENRHKTAEDHGYTKDQLPHSDHVALLPSTQNDLDKAQKEDDENLANSLAGLKVTISS